jgi:glutathione S-transferase
MSYTLYNRDGSGGFAVEAALAMADIPFELISLPSSPGTPLDPSFCATNPWGQVPTLTADDGSVMTETAAILIHLAQLYPNTIAPEPGTAAHGQYVRWLVFAAVNVYESVLRRSYTDRYCDDETAYGAVIGASTRRLADALGVLDDAASTQPFLVSDALTGADLFVVMLYTWARTERRCEHLERIREQVRQHPVVGPLWRRHFGDR